MNSFARKSYTPATAGHLIARSHHGHPEPAGEGIRTYRPTGKKWTVNLEESHTDIVQAKIHNDTLFFLAQGDGSDNIYRIAGAGPVERVTGSRFGISGFSVTGSELLFSDYTAGGFVIASEKTSATAGPAFVTGHEIFPPVAPMPGKVPGKDPSPPVVHTLAADSLSDTPMPLIPEPRPYRKISNLFNFHSWFPFYADLDEIRTDPTTIRPGLTLMSQNHLSTLISTWGMNTVKATTICTPGSHGKAGTRSLMQRQNGEETS